MTVQRRACIFLTALLLAATTMVIPATPKVSAAELNQEKILNAMKAELDRNFAVLKHSDPPVYFMAYRITTTESAEVTATNGSVLTLQPAKYEGDLQIEIRVGSPKLDNCHPLRTEDSAAESSRFVGMNMMPIEGDIDGGVLRQNLWMETEKAYRQAEAAYGRVQAEQGLATEEDTCADFGTEKPVVSIKPVSQTPPNIQLLIDNSKALSKIYGAYPKLEETWVGEKQANIQRFLVNTEGTLVADGKTTVSFYTRAQATAEDGEPVASEETAYFPSVEEAIHARPQLEALVSETAVAVNALRTAPLAEPFCGPTMLKGAAAAVLFHEILGHRLEGSRQRNLSDGKTFAKMLDRQILPSFLTITDRPLLDSLDGVKLVGRYDVDDEGVKAQDVALVKDGKLVDFLMCRTPVPSRCVSNGHGRGDGESHHMPCSRMANLMVQSSKTVSQEELKKQLIAEAKKQSKPYGLLIERVESGLTNTSSQTAQYFQVYPSIVKRVYVDGRPDELVRSVRIVGTPLASLQRIIQTADKVEVFNGACGAESGWVPQANCSPAILIDSLETERQRPTKGIGKILPAPEEEHK